MMLDLISRYSERGIPFTGGIWDRDAKGILRSIYWPSQVERGRVIHSLSEMYAFRPSDCDCHFGIVQVLLMLQWGARDAQERRRGL